MNESLKYIKIGKTTVQLEKGGQVGVALLYSRLQVGHYNG